MFHHLTLIFGVLANYQDHPLLVYKCTYKKRSIPRNFKLDPKQLAVYFELALFRAYQTIFDKDKDPFTTCGFGVPVSTEGSIALGKYLATCNLKIQSGFGPNDNVTYNLWIAHESHKAYFQWGSFGMKTVKMLAQIKGIQQPRNLAFRHVQRSRTILIIPTAEGPSEIW